MVWTPAMAVWMGCLGRGGLLSLASPFAFSGSGLRDFHPGPSAAWESHHTLAAPHPVLSLRGARWAGPRQPGQIHPLLYPPHLRPLGSQEEGLAGRQMVGWEEGLPGRRTTVRTDGELGRGPELTHLLLPLQGFFSVPSAELGWST